LTKKTLRVALLLGGDSSERAISLLTGVALRDALKAPRFDVEVFDVASQPQSESVAGATFLAWNELAATLKRNNFDVVLNALHGGWGEDGTVQTLLEVAGIPFVGTPALGSRVAMDKALCKLLMREHGLVVPRGEIISDVNAPLLYNGNCVVKPNDGGSSVGVSILRDATEAQWREVLQNALRDEDRVLVEELIEGVEVSAPVLGAGASSQALPLIEIVPQLGEGWYDFEAKYAPGGSQHLIPPRLPVEIQERVREHSRRAHIVLGCRGVSRSDFIVKADGTPIFLETNTLPGMTSTSLVPDAARAMGLSFSQLVERLVMSALEN
jgi:D-alanine-D-alanine ligase